MDIISNLNTFNMNYNNQLKLEMKAESRLQKCVIKGNGRWNKGEHKRFILGFSKFGRNWVEVQKLVKTRTLTQVRSHAQKDIQSLLDYELGYEQNSSASFFAPDSMLPQAPEVSTKLQKNQSHQKPKAAKPTIDLVEVFMKAIESQQKIGEQIVVGPMEMEEVKGGEFSEECSGSERQSQLALKEEQKTRFHF